MKKYFILLCVFSGIYLFAQPHPSFTGTGTVGDPYQIWNIYDLIEFGDSVNNQFFPNYSYWHIDKHFILMQDITEPITQSICASFMGHFHGNGKKINSAINFNHPNNQSPAIFNGLSLNGTIDGLIVDGYVNSDIVAMSTISSFINTNSASITNCINNATITGGAAGGITYSNSGIISNCINNGDITGVNIVGGIAGQNDGTIINCINTGNITATASGDNNIFSGVGGIVGTVANHCQNILNCVNIGSVVGQGFVGGIVGLANGHPMAVTPITNCINYGYVRGINGVGGILGYMYSQYVNISNSVNVGVVEGEEDTGSIVGKE